MIKKLFLLDAMALIYRAYYALVKSPRYTSKGVNTSAILGFTNTLYEVIKAEKPTHIAVSFDTGAPTVRHADFQDYKAHRESTPEDIINSIPYIKRILEAFNIPSIVLDGFEADDIIGTIAKKAEIEGFETYMMTSDKDYGQLVSEHIFMYKPGKFGQKAEVLGVNEICGKYEISRPEQLIDILGLWGDASDNIPGVPNIGEVRAKELIKQFDSIENIYKRIDEVKNEKMRQNLINNQDKALMSKMLATIILDVPVEVDFKAMKYDGPDPIKLKAIFDELEFKALTKRIFTDLSLPLNTNHQNAPTLFSDIPDEDNYSRTVSPKEFLCFDDHEHSFTEIKSVDDKTLAPFIDKPHTFYFEWILSQEKIAGFAFSAEDKTVYYHFMENEYRHYKGLLAFLFGRENKIVIYRCKESYKYFKALKIDCKASFFDIKLAHYLIQPETSHQLERLTEKYLNYSLLAVDAKKQGELNFDTNSSPIDNLANNICEKIEVYSKLYPILLEELKKDNLETLFENLELPLSEVLANMEFFGVKVDSEVLQENSQTFAKELAELESEIFKLAGTTFNIASPKQLGTILFEKLHIIENAKLTKTKQYQTGEEILVKLINKHPIVSLILEWRSLSKLKTTYIDALPQLINPKTGRIHTSFNQTVTSTGRLSSSTPNLQNIPIRTERGKDIRKAFVASDNGSVILSADYSQIELRIVAHVCQDEKMIEAFKNNEDIHASMAAQIYRVPKEEVTPLMRRNAKTVNFGILYGISVFGLADRLHIPQKEARELIDEYFRSFPKIQDYLDTTILFAKEHGYVETILNRRRYIRDIDSHNGILRKAAERNAINAPIQGSAADLIKMAMIRIDNILKEKQLNTKMIMQVHDELVFEVPVNEIEMVENLVRDLMSGAMELSVPLSVDINYGKNWYEAH